MVNSLEQVHSGASPLHQHLLASSSLDGKCQSPAGSRGGKDPSRQGLTHTSIICIQSNSVTTLGRKVRNRKVKSPKKTCRCLNKGCFPCSAVHERAAADGGNGKVYGMKTCNHHETNKVDWNSLVKG